MSKRVQKNWAFIHILLDSQSRKQKQALVKTASEEQFKTLAEIVANTLAGSLLVSPSGRKQLLKYKSILRKLSHKSTSFSVRKRLIIRHISTIVKLLSLVKPALVLLRK